MCHGEGFCTFFEKRISANAEDEVDKEDKS